ncbi:hypothetical protein RFM23_09445 [Mesorhizobium abyssinicae]|uniref:DinB family protein n=1 Tax=Mesorhizobium abyssinicae TaxID=1209958 RepID=A0ABU5AKP0_9HYPH|nr:hypothetical protein [Mesorhizobium abyssinicae]MDX8537845.1 hypothetical protein [Mesorhizobium abyssinicae]
MSDDLVNDPKHAAKDDQREEVVVQFVNQALALWRERIRAGPVLDLLFVPRPRASKCAFWFIRHLANVPFADFFFQLGTSKSAGPE